MSNSKILFFAHVLLSLSRDAFCQPQPNATLYIPGVSILAEQFGSPTVPVAVSQVTVQGETTVFQVVEALPTSVLPDALTLTLELSPSGAHLSADAPADGLSGVDITCSISGGDSSCQLAANIADGAATIPFTSSFSETTASAGVPVVAIGVASGSGSNSSTPTASSGSSSNGPSVSQTAGSSITLSTSISSNSSPSSSTGGSSSGTSPAPAASTTQPSSAMGLRGSLVSIIVGFGLVLTSL